MVAHWSLCDSKFPQVSRTVLSIMTDLKNAVVWMVSTRHLISVSFLILRWLYQEHQLQLVSSSLSCSTVFSIPWQGPCTYPYFRFLSILLCGQLGQQSPQFGKFSFTCWLQSTDLAIIITRSGHLAKVIWSVCLSKSQRSLCVPSSRTDVGLYIYHSSVRSNLIFLHNS